MLRCGGGGTGRRLSTLTFKKPRENGKGFLVPPNRGQSHSSLIAHFLGGVFLFEVTCLLAKGVDYKTVAEEVRADPGELRPRGNSAGQEELTKDAFPMADTPRLNVIKL